MRQRVGIRRTREPVKTYLDSLGSKLGQNRDLLVHLARHIVML